MDAEIEIQEDKKVVEAIRNCVRDLNMLCDDASKRNIEVCLDTVQITSIGDKVTNDINIVKLVKVL